MASPHAWGDKSFYGLRELPAARSARSAGGSGSVARLANRGMRADANEIKPEVNASSRARAHLMAKLPQLCTVARDAPGAQNPGRSLQHGPGFVFRTFLSPYLSIVLRRFGHNGSRGRYRCEHLCSASLTAKCHTVRSAHRPWGSTIAISGEVRGGNTARAVSTGVCCWRGRDG
jgi:hypothetical protein